MRVSRAITQTIRGGACEEDVLVRGEGLDKLFMVDSWLQNDHVVTVPSTVTFAPGAGLTPQSVQSIREGLEVDLSRLTGAFPTQKQYLGIRPLLQVYNAQLGAGDSWLQGTCVPFANPFQSHLRPVGVVSNQGTGYTVYQGGVSYKRGALPLLPKAEVWFGVRADGRLGFELLEQQPSPDANPAISAVATLFTYPQTHLGTAFAQQSPSRREAFYLSTYARVLSTIAAFQSATTAGKQL